MPGTTPTPIGEPPSWVRDAVFYQIFPDRFAHSGRVDLGIRIEAWDAEPTFHGYKGGDLWGVIDRLDHLEELGVTAIWFNPIFQSASNHRYHTHDYGQIDPILGGDAAFDALVEAVHDRGMRLILDGVFNHASRGFFAFSDIAEHQEKSAFVDWFRVREFPIAPYDETVPASYDAWWGLHALPAFNTENAAVREFLWKVGEHWIERGADGWRLDVPNEIATPGFWDEFRRRVRAVNPEAYITGEIWSEASGWVGPDGPFDGVMNYKLTTAIIAFAVGNRVNPAALLNNDDYDITPGLHAGEFADRIDWLDRIYDESARTAMLNLLDSHDTARIATIAGGDTELVRLALLLLFVMPGAPCIYYGTEYGLEGGPDPDCRRGMPWEGPDRDLELHAFVTDLIALRRQTPGLRSPVTNRVGPVPGSDFGRTWVARRGEGDERILIAVNHADEPDDVPLAADTIAADAVRLHGSASLIDSAAVGDPDRQVTIVLPPRSWGMWSSPDV